MKRITFLVTNIYKYGGVQRVVSMICNELVLLGKYEITILSLFKTDVQPCFHLNEHIKLKNIYEQPFSLKRNYFKAVKGLKKHLNENEIDILIFAGMGYGSIIRLSVGSNKKVKLVGWEHQSFSFGKIFGLEWFGKRITAKKMDAVIVLTKEDFQDYKTNLNNINNLIQIYNPVNVTSNLSLYNVTSKKIISCGSLIPQKGFDYAVEVARNVFKKHPDWEWHIYGEGDDRNKLEEMINKYDLNNNLILKGYSDEIDKKYNEYSIYVMTSRHEGFPMVLLEAKANKLPIVSFSCKCGPKEVIRDNINGFLIPPFDINEMSQKIMILIEQSEKRELFSTNSFYDIDTLRMPSIIEQWDKFIGSL